MIDDWGMENIRPKEKIEKIHEKAKKKIKGFEKGGFDFDGPPLEM